MNRNHILVGLVSAALSGCLPGEEPASTGTVTAASTACPAWACDTNAATVGDGIIFDELDLAGARNAGGVRIGSARLWDLTPVSLVVERDRLVAVGLADPHRRYTGTELDGMIIVLWYQPAPGSPEEEIDLLMNAVFPVQGADPLTFWSGNPDPVESYEIRARRAKYPPPEKDSFPILVCKGDQLGDEPWPATKIHSALVYQGDHLDAWYRKVSAPASPTLFNLACAGTAMAKLHLTRHTWASNYSGAYPTDLGQRTAMLKMITADYCGTGFSFTVDGHPLRWMDSTTWPRPAINVDTTVPPKDIVSVEAIWGPTGAVCLDVPRLYNRAYVMQQCAPLPCGDVRSDWRSRGHVISGNPPPP
jgi:hypothetical protein